jgi:hypothetical protein
MVARRHRSHAILFDSCFGKIGNLEEAIKKSSTGIGLNLYYILTRGLLACQ